MTRTFMSAWTGYWPAVADHIWQSTLFVLVAALLAWALKNAPPRFRYGIWLAASVKFLIPIALLISAGGYFKLEGPAPIPAQAVAAAVTSMSHPFSQLGSASDAFTPPPSSVLTSAPRANTAVLPAAIAAVWLIGCAVLLLVRARGWRQISKALRLSSEATTGRAVELLRDVERALAVRRPTSLRSSSSVVEPAVVGFFRPVLLWPAALTDRLSDAEMTSIFAHELTHLRRRDNLTALLHIVVETVFWFHPMTWWLSSRLVEERERACDQSVLATGAEPQTYAEGLLTVCKMCLESPLRCAAGVTGSGLVKRVERIMRGDHSRRLRLVERALLAATAVVIVTVPVAAGMFTQSPQMALATIVAPATALQSPIAPAPIEVAAVVTPAPPPASFVATGVLPAALRAGSLTSLSAPQTQAALPADPEAPKVRRGDLIRIERGPTQPWTITVMAEGEMNLPGFGTMAFEGMTAKQIEFLVRQRLAEGKLISATDLITVVVRRMPDPQYAGELTGARGGAPPPPTNLTVFVMGAVKTPGQQSIPADRMTILGAISRAGGFAVEAGADVWLRRPPDVGRGPVAVDNRQAQSTNYSRKDLISGLIDPPIQAGDTIFVSQGELFWISGEVRSAGQKVWEPNMTVADALAMASGLTDQASLRRSYIQRKNARGTIERIGELKVETPVLARDVLVIAKKLF